MENTSTPANRTRRRWLIAGTLVVATALAGTAARGKWSAAPTGGTAERLRRFSAAASRQVSFTGTLDRTAVLVGAEPVVRMELVMAAEQRPAIAGTHRPTDLVVILDRSGSMNGEKLENARAAVGALVANLTPADRFALVTYSDGASLAIPLAASDDGASASWLATLAAIGAGGGTNMASGLDLGLDIIDASRAAGRVPRAILISDGLANQGDASRDGLLRRAGRAARGEYMLTTVGVGADFDEYLMSALADAGTGNYYYLASAADLTNVVAREFDAARATVASGLEVRIEPGDGVQVLDAAGYPLERAGGAVVFHPGALFAGQERHVWVALSVPNRNAADHELGRFTLAYTDAGKQSTLAFSEIPRVASVQREDDFVAAIDAPTWTRSVVVDAYNQMQQEVARDLKAGNREAALNRMRGFAATTEALNSRLQSAPVQEKLDALGKLEADVRGAFVGPNQAARQNELSKTFSANALDQRRAGSKR
jgi:Ca-activated chloride channel family protein